MVLSVFLSADEMIILIKQNPGKEIGRSALVLVFMTLTMYLSYETIFEISLL